MLTGKSYHHNKAIMKMQTVRLKLFIIFLAIVVIPPSNVAFGQTELDPWPPFYFTITPTHEDGKIKYEMRFSGLVDWPMEDIRWRIPIPEGTRFVEGDAQATTTVTFDGDNVVFFTSVFHRPIRHAVFVLEITDPDQTVFTTNVMIDWIGAKPGQYLLENVTIDLNKESLTWGRPRYSVGLGFIAEVKPDDTVTYTLYPQNYSSYLRIWDLRINVPIPEGTTLLSMDTPAQYGVTTDGKEVYFKAAEMPKDIEIEPLRFTISTKDIPDDETISTRAWVVWKNSGWGVGWRQEVEQSYVTGDISVKPRKEQRATADLVGDVPLANYDVTNLILEDEGTNLKVTFETRDVLQPDDPAVFLIFLDIDCRTDTGEWRNNLGVEYRAQYQNFYKQAILTAWNFEEKRWQKFRDSTPIEYEVKPKQVTIQIPYNLLGVDKKFCWININRNDTDQYNTRYMPADRVPDIFEPAVREYKLSYQSHTALQLDDLLAGKELVLIPIQKSTVTPSESANVDTNPTAQQPTNNNPTSPSVQPTATILPQQSTVVVEDAYIVLGDVWNYQPGWETLPDNWMTLNFDDGAWYSGNTTIGYGDGSFETDLSSPLSYTEPTQNTDSPTEISLENLPQTDFTSLFLRREFNLVAPDSVEKLTMTIDYEDGFVAYLNGVEVARRGIKASTPLSVDTLATNRDSGVTETIDLSDYIDELVDGSNLLAIQVHRSLGRSSLFVSPALTWERNSNVVAQAQPTSATVPAQATAISTKPPVATTKPTATLITTIATETAEPQPTATPSNPVFVPENPDIIKIDTPTSIPQPTPQTVTQANAEPNTATPSPKTEGVVIADNEANSNLNETPIIPTPTLPPLNVDTLLITPEPTIPGPMIDFSPPNPNPSIVETTGKIAIPVDNGSGTYNVHVYNIRFGYGWEGAMIPSAHQPDMSLDGQRMLVNSEGGGPEDNISEFTFLSGSLSRVSDNSLDSFPTYDPWANRVAYNNPNITTGPDGTPRSHILVQCSVLPPHLEPDQRCREITSFGVLVGAAQVVPIEGSHAVWGSNDQIIYKGCNSWLNGAKCGIYSVASSATRAFSDGLTPYRLTDNTSDIPTDTYGNHIAFMSQRDGNWEVYVMGLDGRNIRNLSNNGAANDGLPTISPDGDWLAFASDRDGLWAVWAVPLAGGTPEKLFDFPSQSPWGTHERAWTNERISWGW